MEGKLPEHWVNGKLYEIMKPVPTNVKEFVGEKKYFSTGSVSQKKIEAEGIFTYNTRPSRANREVEVNDVLQARMKNTNKAFWVTDEFKNDLFSTGFMQLRSYGNTVNSKYVFYYLNSSFFLKQKDDLATGATQQAINDGNASKLDFPLPPIAEQERIITKLDALFAQQEEMKKALSRIPALLKDFRQQVLTKAVTGKLTESWREGKYLEEWKIVSSSTFFTFITSGSRGWAKYYDNDGDQLFVRITNMNYGTSSLDLTPAKLQFLKLPPNNNEGKRTLLKPRDILISITAEIGMISLIPKEFPFEAYVNQHICLARPSENICEKYLVNYLISENGFGQLKEKKRGATKAGLTLGDIRNLKIDLPPIVEQKEIVSRVESLFAKADVIEQRYKNLKEKIDQLPQALLHKAFKGELVAQLPSDGDAKDLLKEILALKKEGTKK